MHTRGKPWIAAVAIGTVIGLAAYAVQARRDVGGVAAPVGFAFA
jgi:hypothetical protein